MNKYKRPNHYTDEWFEEAERGLFFGICFTLGTMVGIWELADKCNIELKDRKLSSYWAFML